MKIKASILPLMLSCLCLSACGGKNAQDGTAPAASNPAAAGSTGHYTIDSDPGQTEGGFAGAWQFINTASGNGRNTSSYSLYIYADGAWTETGSAGEALQSGRWEGDPYSITLLDTEGKGVRSLYFGKNGKLLSSDGYELAKLPAGMENAPRAGEGGGSGTSPASPTASGSSDTSGNSAASAASDRSNAADREGRDSAGQNTSSADKKEESTAVSAEDNGAKAEEAGSDGGISGNAESAESESGKTQDSAAGESASASDGQGESGRDEAKDRESETGTKAGNSAATETGTKQNSGPDAVPPSSDAIDWNAFYEADDEADEPGEDLLQNTQDISP